MAQLDLHIHIGDEVIAGGSDGVKSKLQWQNGAALSVDGQQAGVVVTMDEFARVEPSDSTGATGGTYEPYWDGDTFAITSDGTPTTTTIGLSTATWDVNEWAGREVEITSGTYSGEKVRVVSNTATEITFTPALAGAPSSGDTFTIKGGFVKFFAPASTQLGVGVVAGQKSASGVNWFGINAIDQTTLWINRLVNVHGITGTGFRMYKRAGPGNTDTWMTGQTNGDTLDTDLGLLKDYETNAGNTLRVKSVVIDAAHSDIFNLNLDYKSDLLRLIDSVRSRLETLGVTEAKTSATATASTTTTLTVASAGWTVDQFKGRTVRLTSGAANGELAMVASNTTDTITVVTVSGGTYSGFSTAPGTPTLDILASPLIVVASPKIGTGATTYSSGDPILSLGTRAIIQEVADIAQSVRVHDWETANWAVVAKLSPLLSDRYYDVPSYIAAGYALHNTVQAFYTTQPTAAPGAAIPCVVMIGTSQSVTSGNTPTIITQMKSKTFTQSGSDIMPGAYIWDNVNEQVSPYNVASNASTFGSVESMWGPEVTLLRDLIRDKWTTGVVVFKFALAGVALTSEAGTGNVAGYIEPGGHWETIEAQWAKFKQAVVRDLNRSVDVVAVCNDLGENDLLFTSEFATKAPLHIDRCRALFQTRVSDDYEIPIVWQQGPPPLSTTAGGSALGNAADREAYRAAVANLPNLRTNCAYIPSNVKLYGLKHTDDIHYDGEAALNLGEAWAVEVVKLFTAEGAAPEVPESATLIVETGSGLPDANSYASVAFVDDYFLYRSNPTTWTDATTADKEQALRMATFYISERYGNRWRGVIDSDTQALDWPRSGVVDGDTGLYYDNDEMPKRLLHATAEIALRYLAGTTLRPDVEPGDGNITSSTVSVGAISITEDFVGTATIAPDFPIVRQQLRSLLTDAGASLLHRVTR